MSFPLLTELSSGVAFDNYKMQKEIYNHTKPSSNEEIENGKREIFIDFNKQEKGKKKMRGGVNQEGKVIIKLRDMKKQSEEIKNRVKNQDREHPNVLLIFLDTVSRQQFHRKYKESAEFLKQRHFSKKGKIEFMNFSDSILFNHSQPLICSLLNMVQQRK